MLRTPRTYVGIAMGLGAAALAGLASYSNLAARTPVRPAPETTAATKAPETFQAYTVLQGLPPKPVKRTYRHGKLRLTKIHGKYYLAGADNHYYLAGRNRQGHLVPVYHDTATNKDYPLYYDHNRDRYYRITEDSQTHQFLRNYEGDPEDRLFEDSSDNRAGQEVAQDNSDNGDYPGTEDYQPGLEDQPDIVVGDRSSNSEDWLLAIPVIAAAFLLLRPRHHAIYRIVPPSNMVAVVAPGRPHETGAGHLPHVANPPIFVRPHGVPMINGVSSIPNTGMQTHHWLPPGSPGGNPPAMSISAPHIAPPAHPPLFQHGARHEGSTTGFPASAPTPQPEPVIHATPPVHTVTSIAHNVKPASVRDSNFHSRPAMHSPDSASSRQSVSSPEHTDRAAVKSVERRVSVGQEPHNTQSTPQPAHRTAAVSARSESAAPVTAARSSYSPPRAVASEHVPAKPAASTPAAHETASASPAANRPQAPQESAKPVRPETTAVRQSNPPPTPARQETQPASLPRPAANEPPRSQQPASSPPASHTAPAEQPHTTPPQPQHPAPEPPRAAPTEPPRAAPPPQPSHTNENHGNDNTSGSNNGGKIKK